MSPGSPHGKLDAPGTGSTGSTGNSLAKYSACETITALMKMHRSTVNFSWHLECKVLIFPLLPKTPGIGLDVAICSLKMPKAPSQTYPRYQKYRWHYSTIHSYFPYKTLGTSSFFEWVHHAHPFILDWSWVLQPTTGDSWTGYRWRCVWCSCL